MFLTKGPLGLELARNDRVDLLAHPEERQARLDAVARLLPEEDRRLVHLIIARGLSHRAAACDLNLTPGVVTRRLHRLRAMLASPTLRAIADHIGTLPQPTRQIAVDHFFKRVPIRDIARAQRVNFRAVRSQLDYIRGWARALHHQSTVGND